MEKVTGTKLNEELKDRLEKEVRELYIKERLEKEPDKKAEIEEAAKDEEKIVTYSWSETEEEIKEQYKSLMVMRNMISWSAEEEPENVYDFTYTREKEGKKEYNSIGIRKSDIATGAITIKDLIKLEKVLNIQFDDELFRLIRGKDTSFNKNIPGQEFEAPEPKNMAETKEEYEKRVIDYYNSKGIPKAPLEAIPDVRAPYPHEQIDYRKDPIKVDPNHVSIKYEESFRDKLIPKTTGTTTPAEEGIVYDAGNRTNVKNTGILSNIKEGTVRWFKNKFSEDNKTKAKYIAVGSVAGLAACLASAGVGSVISLAGAPWIGLGTLAAGSLISVRAIVKHYKKKWRNRNKPKKDEPEKPTGTDEPEEPENIEEPTEEPTEEITIDAEDFTAEVAPYIEMIRELTAKIQIDEENIKNFIQTEENKDEYNALVQQKIEKIEQLKAAYNELLEAVEHFKNSYKGRSL